MIYGALAAAVAAAAALRFPFLGHQSLWYDETFTSSIVTAPSLGDVWHGVKSTEASPPLYYLVTWAFGKLFGVQSDAGLRATGAIASVASVPVAFAAVRRFVGDRTALATAAVAATSPLLVAYALDARSYSLLVLLALGSIWAMARVLERPTRGRWLAWVLLAAACLWTHYFAGFLVLAEVCVLVWRLPALRLHTVGWTAVAAALFAPVIPVLAAQTDSRTDHIGTLPLGNRVKDAVRQFAMGPNVPRAALEAAGLALAVGGLALGLAAIRRREHPARPLAAIAAIALGVPLALGVIGIADRFLVRNALIAWGCVAAIAALGLIRARALPLVAYLVVSVTAVVWIQSDWRYRNADWAGAARTARPAPTDPIAEFPRFYSPVAARYFHRPRLLAGPLTTATAWIVTEPARLTRRELVPIPGAPPVPPGFAIVRRLGYRGFRMYELRAPRPVPLSPASFGADAAGDLPAVLAP